MRNILKLVLLFSLIHSQSFAGLIINPNPTVTGVHAGDKVITAGTACPAGTIPEDGSAVSRTTYAVLFAAIGTTYGVGDGSTTFNVPNAKGVFDRGAGSQTIGGVTYTATQGTTLGDALQGHFHSIATNTTSFTVNGGIILNNPNSGSVPSYNSTVGSPITDGANGTPRVSTETRPVNITHLHCITTNNSAALVTPVASQPGITITTSTTAVIGQVNFFCNATSGSVVVTLPQIATLGSSNLSHQIFCLKKIDSSANTCTFTANASDLIDGAGTLVISSQYTSKCIIDNAGTAWYVH